MYLFGLKVLKSKEPIVFVYSARHNHPSGGPNVWKNMQRPLGQPKLRLSNS